MEAPMTNPEEEASKPSRFRLVDRDRVQVEFLIDDLLRQIGAEGLRPIAACNGCNTCSAAADLPGDVTK
jgi:hypothetical protein